MRNGDDKRGRRSAKGAVPSNGEISEDGGEDAGDHAGKLVIGAVRRLSLRISVPLREGQHALPTLHADAEITVRPETQVVVLARVGRSDDGELRLTTAEVRFTNEITIKNPASALSPTEGFLGGAIDWIKDALADVRVGRVHADAGGQVHVDGVVVKPWPLGESPLEEEIPEGTLPELDLDIESMLFGPSEPAAKEDEDSAPPAEGASKRPSLEALLRAAGAMSERGKLTLEMETVPLPGARLAIATSALKVAWPARPFTLRMTGKAGIGEDGALTLTLSRATSPALGAVTVSGQLRLLRDGGVWNGEGSLRPKLDLAGTKIQISPAPGVEIPLDIQPGSAIGLEAHVNLEHGLLSIDRASAKLHVRAGLEGTFDPRLSWHHRGGVKIGRTSLLLSNGELTVEARAKLHIAGKSIALDAGSASARVVADDLDLRYRRIGTSLGAKIEASVACEDLAFGSDGVKRSGRGTATFAIVPRGDGGVAKLPSIRRSASFSLGGGLPFDVGPEGLSELLTSTLELSGKGEALVARDAPAAGCVASDAIKARITERTGALVRSKNRVELLVDGVRSYPKRLEMIRSAKSSICLQTLIFKDDEVGTATAAELVAAAARKVTVRVIVDALGNVDRPTDLVEGKRLYRTLAAGGVRIELYNDSPVRALKEIMKIVAEHPELGGLDGGLALLRDPGRAITFFTQLFRIAGGRAEASPEVRDKVRGALGMMFGARRIKGDPLSIDDLAAFGDDGVLSMSELLLCARQVADLNHRWHEKYLVVDGRAAILGGMNIADEYMLGGTDRMVDCNGALRPAWRDTDVYIEGPAAIDAYQSFSDNWTTITLGRETMPKLDETSAPPAGDVDVQVIQHRPYDDGDHHIANFMLETIKALEKGHRAWIANAYFLPTGALRAYKEALMDAARRGVDVRVLTNSGETSDLPQINDAALYPYRELLAAGVRIWERTGKRTMHTKMAVFGSCTIAIGSWNADNRSESLNSEALAVVYDCALAEELEAVLEKDRDPSVAREILAAEVASRPLNREIDAMLASIASDLM